MIRDPLRCLAQKKTRKYSNTKIRKSVAVASLFIQWKGTINILFSLRIDGYLTLKIHYTQLGFFLFG